MNVFHNVHLTLMLRKPKARWRPGQTPLARVIIDRKADVFDKRRPRKALRIVLVVHTRCPDSREIDLSESRDSGEQNESQNERNRESGTIDDVHNMVLGRTL